MTEHQARAEELLADYRRSRERLAEAQRELAAVRASASSPDGLVTATVGARGALTGLEISDRAYERYRPSELATQIVRVTAEATTEALAGAGQVLAPMLGSGTDPTAVVLGTGDLTAAEFTAAESATGESAAHDATAADAG
ncbi:YbaB/EbfC family nucleoid-associated protein, partial [Saccharomonospora saliphila]|uniref:YbaB/EbfC family nucleoid-associated protein n=1 Tax=Saccharomonospora saliphila TaxID=369829 RepID=UPI000367EB54